MDNEKSALTEGKGEEQETRERILSAASQLMARKGYKGATTKKIAELAGVNEVTLFRHFKSKDGILQTILKEMSETEALFKKIIERDFPSLRQMLIQYAREYYKIMVDRKELMMICIIESGNHPEFISLFSRVPITAAIVLAEKLEQLHEQGLVGNVDFLVAAQMFISTLYTTFVMRYRVQETEFMDREETVFTSATEILVKGLQVS